MRLVTTTHRGTVAILAWNSSAYITSRETKVTLGSPSVPVTGQVVREVTSTHMAAFIIETNKSPNRQWSKGIYRPLVSRVVRKKPLKAGPTIQNPGGQANSLLGGPMDRSSAQTSGRVTNVVINSRNRNMKKPFIREWERAVPLVAFPTRPPPKRPPSKTVTTVFFPSNYRRTLVVYRQLVFKTGVRR